MTKHTGFCRVILFVAMFCPGLWAQQPGGAPGSTSAQSTSEAGQTPQDTSNAPAPDTRPLSGAEEITAGLRHGARNYVLPSLQVNAYGDSNQTVAPGGTKGSEVTGSITGRLAVQRVTRKSQLTMDYMGGGIFYSRDPALNATMHQFGITENFRGRRWGLMLADRASYLPESAFGFSGFGGLGGFSPGLGGSFGANLGNLNPAYSLGQSILSGRGDRVSNTTVAQVEYNSSARSTFTVSGSYGLLRFRQPGSIESDQRVYTGGYNYMATRKDAVAITYGLAQMRFKGVSQGIDNHFLQMSYGRRVTGRLGLELAGGPQITVFQHSTTASDRHISWTASTSVHYRASRADLGLSYTHYTSAGSGLLLGAETDQFQGSVGWHFSRNWSGSLSPGYAHNTRLKQNTVGGASISYDSIYAGFGVQRTLGRYMDISFNYNLQDQRTSVSGASTPNSANTYVRHLFGFGFSWHTRPVTID